MFYTNPLEDSINPDKMEYRLIPDRGAITKTIEIELRGFPSCEFPNEDANLNELFKISDEITKSFLNFYKDSYAFSYPKFGYKPDIDISKSKYLIMISMMDNESYEELMNSKTQKPV